MKKLQVIVVCLATLSLSTQAQYRFIRNKYDYRTYSYMPGDRYNPSLAGAASLILPGLGQAICGESGRGLIFFSAFGVSGTVFSIGAIAIMMEVTNSMYGGNRNDKFVDTSLYMIYGGLGGMIVTYIWAVTDAVRVAKVKNLYLREKNGTALNLRIEPFICPGTIPDEISIQAGIALKVRF